MILPEHEANRLLSGAGIPMVPVRVVNSADEARKEAANLGYPVALKLSSALLTHKTEVGGVILNISDDEQVKDAFRKLRALQEQLDPHAALISAATPAARPLPGRSHRHVLRAAAAEPALELAGCYVVDDDLLLVTRWLTCDVPVEGDPLRNLAAAFLHHSESTAAKFEPDQREKGQYLVRSVRRTGAEGVIFASSSFCDPALLDRPMLQHVLADAGIPYIAFKYAENSGQMQPIREQAGTFADSIKLWSGQ